MRTWPDVDVEPRISLGAFTELVTARGIELYRDLPWRRTHDPYAIWLSEVMLQQTQVTRVDGRWQRWLERFPSIEALANAEQADVLQEWQGMGYNRRALSLLKAAQAIVGNGGVFPHETSDLTALPGIGPATAAGIRAFAFNLPGVYLETNVRTVFLHELYPKERGVPDKRLVPLVQAACDCDDPRSWYYALLDYGAWLKRTVPNPSRRSSAHVKQSSFEGSHRQKRAMVVRLLLAARDEGVVADDVACHITRNEASVGRAPFSTDDAKAMLEELEAEGFCHRNGNRWIA